jgi:hypothetical protein
MKGELGSASRALLDAARDGLSPDTAAIARVRAGVGASVGGAVAGSLAAKLGLLGLAVVIATGAALYLRRARDVSSIAPAAIVDEPRLVREPAPTRVVAREELPEASEEAMPPMIVSREAAVSLPRDGARRPARRADLRREVELIDQAMAAMHRGDPAAALAAVHTHATETANAGQLAEDAAAIEVEALCRLHDSTVGAKLAAFDVRWPESAQRSRLTTSCH